MTLDLDQFSIETSTDPLPGLLIKTESFVRNKQSTLGLWDPPTPPPPPNTTNPDVFLKEYLVQLTALSQTPNLVWGTKQVHMV